MPGSAWRAGRGREGCRHRRPSPRPRRRHPVLDYRQRWLDRLMTRHRRRRCGRAIGGWCGLRPERVLDHVHGVTLRQLRVEIDNLALSLARTLPPHGKGDDSAEHRNQDEHDHPRRRPGGIAVGRQLVGVIGRRGCWDQVLDQSRGCGNIDRWRVGRLVGLRRGRRWGWRWHWRLCRGRGDRGHGRRRDRGKVGRVGARGGSRGSTCWGAARGRRRWCRRWSR